MVWEVHQAVDVPLLGMGGISCATDAVEFILAGATAVAVGTANFVNPHATVETVSYTHLVRDMIAAGDISLMINTPFGHATRADGYELRLEAVKHGVTHVTNLAGAQAMVAGMEAARLGGLAAVALQDLPQWELSR